MGAAWAANEQFPWEGPRYLGGIENVKINVMMRIYSNKWHVYAGLAIMNPSARDQIRQYAKSVTELLKMMQRGERVEFTRRIKAAGAAVFGTNFSNPTSSSSRDLLLDDKVLDRFSLGEVPAERVRNSHLSLLAMVDCWSKLGIVPYNHMICSTPVNATFLSNPSPNHNNHLHQLSDTELSLTLNTQLFRMWLGITEYLFCTPKLLEETITTAIDDVTFRGDDLEFTFAARVSNPFYIFIPLAVVSVRFITRFWRSVATTLVSVNPFGNLQSWSIYSNSLVSSNCNFTRLFSKSNKTRCAESNRTRHESQIHLLFLLRHLKWCLRFSQDWSERVDLKAFDAYREKFEKIQQYFAPRFPEAQKIGNEMIKTILEKTGKD
jgi:hypothetical protein